MVVDAEPRGLRDISAVAQTRRLIHRLAKSLHSKAVEVFSPLTRDSWAGSSECAPVDNWMDSCPNSLDWVFLVLNCHLLCSANWILLFHLDAGVSYWKLRNLFDLSRKYHPFETRRVLPFLV